MATPAKKIKTSFTITTRCKELIWNIAQNWGISQSAAVEIAVREKWERYREKNYKVFGGQKTGGE